MGHRQHGQASRHQDPAPAMAAADGGEPRRRVQPRSGPRRAFAQKHGARAAYSQLGDLLEDSRVDGIFVVPRRTPCMPSTSSRRRKPESTCCARSRWPRRSPTPCEWCTRAAARASHSAWPSTCASTRPIDALASSSPPGHWGASSSPRRSGPSACAAAMAHRRVRRSRSGGTRRS